MRNFKYIYALLLLIMFAPFASADGGYWTIKCTKTVACPAGQTGAITYTAVVNGNAFNCNSGGIYWGQSNK